MTLETLLHKPWVKWPALLVFWTLIGLAFASQFYVSSAQFGNPVPWKYAVSRSLADWYVFAALSLPAIWIGARFPLVQGFWKRGIVVHFAASAAFSVLWVALRVAVAWLQSVPNQDAFAIARAFQDLLAKTFLFNLLVYWVIVTVIHAINYYRKFHERELRAAELEKRLTQAKLQALQMQLNPHFLFNTLHSISSLMHKNVEAADRMIARLSDLLRLALESTDEHEVPLRQELSFLDRYLEIEQTRFGDRLQVHKEIAPDTLDAVVPNLILQPLVENAIRHGIEPHARRGQIELCAKRENEMLRLEVSDNGAGIVPTDSPEEGVGLSNTRARLQQLYGKKHQFELGPAAGGGLSVTLRFPFRMAAIRSTEDLNGRR
ncbi:MAG: histidine kinase [Verrucomicrobia bacterium]|nr:MAG: histidine kinase [Verrucomicrobiota bacterium]